VKKVTKREVWKEGREMKVRNKGAIKRVKKN